MQDVWTRIETWLAANAPKVRANLNDGATDQEIRETEAFLGVTFPEDVRASFRIHNGEAWDASGLMGGQEFLSLERIRDEWQVWKEGLDAGDFDDDESDPDEGVRNDWWNAKWIPLTYDGSGNHDCLDLDPAPGGDVGQIITMWHDASDRPLVAPSFRAWLEAFADDLASGKYTYSDKYGGLTEVLRSVAMRSNAGE